MCAPATNTQAERLIAAVQHVAAPSKQMKPTTVTADGAVTISCPKCGKTAADFPSGPAGLRNHMTQCKGSKPRKLLPQLSHLAVNKSTVECPKCGKTIDDFYSGYRGLCMHIVVCKAVTKFRRPKKKPNIALTLNTEIVRKSAGFVPPVPNQCPTCSKTLADFKEKGEAGFMSHVNSCRKTQSTIAHTAIVNAIKIAALGASWGECELASHLQMSRSDLNLFMKSKDQHSVFCTNPAKKRFPELTRKAFDWVTGHSCRACCESSPLMVAHLLCEGCYQVLTVSESGTEWLAKQQNIVKDLDLNADNSVLQLRIASENEHAVSLVKETQAAAAAAEQELKLFEEERKMLAKKQDQATGSTNEAERALEVAKAAGDAEAIAAAETALANALKSLAEARRALELHCSGDQQGGEESKNDTENQKGGKNDAEEEDYDIVLDASGPRYKCRWSGCDACFSDKNKIRRHMIVHTGARPWLCPVAGCGRMFSQDFNARAHLRRHATSGDISASVSERCKLLKVDDPNPVFIKIRKRKAPTDTPVQAVKSVPQAQAVEVETECPNCGKHLTEFPSGSSGLHSHIRQCRVEPFSMVGKQWWVLRQKRIWRKARRSLTDTRTHSCPATDQSKITPSKRPKKTCRMCSEPAAAGNYGV